MIPIPDDYAEKGVGERMHYIWLIIDFMQCKFRIFDTWRDPGDEKLMILITKVIASVRFLWTLGKTLHRAYSDLNDFQYEIAYMPKHTEP